VSSRFEIRLDGGKGSVTGIRLGEDSWSVTAIDEEGRTVRRLNSHQLVLYLTWLKADDQLSQKNIGRRRGTMNTRERVILGRSPVSGKRARQLLEKAAMTKFVPVEAALAREIEKRAKRAKVSAGDYIAVLFDLKAHAK
jgi:hypothetical protein